MKNNNWKKNVKETYNNPEREFKKFNEEPQKIISGTTVRVYKDDVNGALKKLKKILERDNRQKDLAKNECYEKPSIKRKRKMDVAKSRWRRNVDQMRKSNIWVDSIPTDTKWLKTKKKRRAHVGLVQKVKNRAKPQTTPKAKRKR